MAVLGYTVDVVVPKHRNTETRKHRNTENRTEANARARDFNRKLSPNHEVGDYIPVPTHEVDDYIPVPDHEVDYCVLVPNHEMDNYIPPRLDTTTTTSSTSAHGLNFLLSHCCERIFPTG